MDTPVLNVTNLSKSIKKKEIIKDISFQLNKGEVLGFLGPNGAGKSTTLRMLVACRGPAVGPFQSVGIRFVMIMLMRCRMWAASLRALICTSI